VKAAKDRTRELKADVKATHRRTHKMKDLLEVANGKVQRLKAQRDMLQRQKAEQAHRVAGDKAELHIRYAEERCNYLMPMANYTL
jgi:hypothetical protein